MAITKIQTVTTTGAEAVIDFTSIPATFTDLWVEVSARTGAADDNLFYKFNGSTSSYTVRNLLGIGSGSGVSQTPSISAMQAGGLRNTTASTFGSTSIYVPNYAGATNKSSSVDHTSEGNETQAYQFLVANLWANTSAITQITLFLQGGGNFASGSTATLYGILKGSSGGVTVS